MNVAFDPEEFAPLIEQAVDAAVRRCQAGPTNVEPEKILLTKAEASHALGVSQSSVDRWRRENGLPHLKLNGVVLFRPESLREWAASRETT